MRVLAAILIALGCVVGVVYLAGHLQPEQRTATRSAVIAASPADVWTRINDVADEPKWRKSVRSVRMDAPQDGKPCYTEDVRVQIHLCVERIDGERLRVVSIADPKGIVAGTWTLLVQPGDATHPNGNTTRLTVTEDAAIHSALWRGVLLLTGTDRNVNQYVNDLSRSFSGAPEQS